MPYSNILPAPGTRINGAGLLDPAGLPAPGFSGLNVKLNQSSDVQRTRSNRGLTISGSEYFWSFDIRYHPMLEEEYIAIESFLLGHNTKVKPFYVALPNYSTPKPEGFNTHQIANPVTVTGGNYFAGDTQVAIVSTNNTLTPGCFINFVDSSDALHKSTYKVSRVESPASFSGVAPAAGTLRLSIFPPLQRNMSTGVAVRFTQPLFRVIQRSELNPEYDQNNTVSFGLTVEEILP